MLCVYPANCTDFSNNGMGAISPSSATVKETLNGSYELEIVHPYDAEGKWQRFVEGYIVRAPVPSAMTPQVKLAPQTSASGMVYRVSTNRDPLRLRSGTGTKYKILGKYKKGTQVIVLAKTTSSWYEVTCPDGKHGYMSASYLTYVKTLPAPEQAAAEVVEARQLRDQPFRIYRVVPELNKVTAYARHVFYDLLDNMIKKLEPGSSDTGTTVMQSLSEGCLSEHPFTFYSDLTSTAEEVSFENKNPVDCLLGDGGIIENYGGEIMRDWFDVFVVERVGNDTNIEIRQGKNLTGIKYDVDMTDVTTRIMPTGQDKDGNILYLPEGFVDSPLIENYPFPKWIHLEVSEAKEVTKGKSSEKKSKNQCYVEMRQAAQDEFDKGCDLPNVTLTVEFIDVTETEEYKQYSFLQSIFLGDAVRVIARGIGVSVSMRMTEYSYDCLTRKYITMTLGTVADTLAGNVITSRQLPNGSITGAKLAINSVGIGQLQSGSVGELQIQEASIANGHIQNAAIGAANIQSAAILYAHIAAATINSLKSDSIEATTAKIQSLTAQDIATDSLAAALAAFTVITCGAATFDAATIQHLVANSMNLEYGAAGQVFIRNLAVEYAQMIGASIGNLCIKASDGNYYSIDVDSEGNVTGTPTTVTEEEIDAGETESGRVILETSITASQLNTSDLLATYGLINRIDAARIDVDQLIARQAFIDKINTTVIHGNQYIELTVGDMVDDAVEGISESISQAQSTADEAQSAASSAQSVASSAQSVAAQAQAAAERALSNTEVIVGTQTAATGVWTGVASFSELRDGQQIVYWLPYAGSGYVTLNLTLAGGGTTGAKEVYYSGANRLSTHYAAGNAIHLTYRVNANINGSSYTGWWADANYNSNYYDRMMLANAIKAKTAISASFLIVGDSGGYFHLVAGSIFDVDKPMLWAGSAITANSTGSNNYLSYPSCTLRNNAGSSWTATQYATLYLAGTLIGNSFVVASESWLTTAPANETLTYIALGYMYSTYQMYFYPEHPMFRLVDGVLTAVSQMAYEAQVAASTAQATADAARADFRRVVRIDNDGLHVGDNQSTGEVLIDSESVNVVMNGSKYSRFAGNYVQFGNYQLRRTTDGGLAFKMTDI